MSTGPSCLPRLQEIVVHLVIANSVVQHAVPKQKLKTLAWQSHLSRLNIDTRRSNLLSDF
jgi:hypothetical protein